MGTFSSTYWLFVPASSAVNDRLAAHFAQFSDDRAERGVHCTDGSRTVLKNGWRADHFGTEAKLVLRSFTGREIELYRCVAGTTHGVPWRRGLLKALPRGSRYAKPTRRKAKATAA